MMSVDPSWPTWIVPHASMGSKVAVQVSLAAMVTVALALVPEQAPDQALNVELESAVAVRRTRVPSVKLATQVAPQSMPVGLLVTVPWPVPLLVTVSVCVTTNSKLAVQVKSSWLTTTLAAAVVPEQAPLQPANLEPAPADAMSITVPPATNAPLQVAPPAVPPGRL